LLGVAICIRCRSEVQENENLVNDKKEMKNDTGGEDEILVEKIENN